MISTRPCSHEHGGVEIVEQVSPGMAEFAHRRPQQGMVAPGRHEDADEIRARRIHSAGSWQGPSGTPLQATFDLLLQRR